LLAWYRIHGRKDLPWQHPVAPYRVWISEIMLQQTQVQAVIPYFEKFLARFADVHALAAASVDEVLHLWSGLGYYARARNLHRAANLVVSEHAGELPRELDVLMTLPGIGRSTAAAILALSFGDRHAILDGNVKRVLCRYHAIEGWPGTGGVARRLWAIAEAHTPDEDLAAYTQAVMDLGATVCARSQPRCDECPKDAKTSCPNPSRAKRRRCARRCLSSCATPAAGCCWNDAHPPASGAVCGAFPNANPASTWAPGAAST
jgi:A/G-specific adenine glycosylase